MEKASADESGAARGCDVSRGHKHIVELNTSGGYTVIKSSKVIQQAASLWGWTVCNVLTRFMRQSPIEVNLAGDIILL